MRVCSNASIKKRFLHSLKRGTGEAYLIIEKNPTIDFTANIIKGALKNYAYDGQIENSRAEYIYDIIMLSNNKEKICKALQDGIAREQVDTWSLTHMIALAKLFAQEGDQELREAIRNRFFNHPIEGSDWVGYKEIIELDGLEGLIYVAQKFGEGIAKNSDDWQDDDAVLYFQDKYPEIDGFAELENRAKNNQFIQLYLDSIACIQQSRKTRIFKEHTFEDIIDEVINKRPFLSFKRRRELTKNEVLTIAKELLKEKDKLKIGRLLDVFSEHKFPFNPAIILAFAKKRPNSKDRITQHAINTLMHLESNEIREFALNKIMKSNRPYDYLDILVSNYQKGDYKLLVQLANRFISEHIIELLAGSYVRIYEANKTVECKDPLEILYEKSNCGVHRHYIIKILLDNDVLSKKIYKEMQYDSYQETRKLFRRYDQSIDIGLVDEMIPTP